MAGLEERLGSILNVDPDEINKHKLIVQKSWILNDVYSYQDNVTKAPIYLKWTILINIIKTSEEEILDVFFLNDEVGSRIYHSGLRFIG